MLQVGATGIEEKEEEEEEEEEEEGEGEEWTAYALLHTQLFWYFTAIVHDICSRMCNNLIGENYCPSVFAIRVWCKTSTSEVQPSRVLKLLHISIRVSVKRK
jgi:hypothetical protein